MQRQLGNTGAVLTFSAVGHHITRQDPKPSAEMICYKILSTNARKKFNIPHSACSEISWHSKRSDLRQICSIRSCKTAGIVVLYTATQVRSIPTYCVTRCVVPAHSATRLLRGLLARSLLVGRLELMSPCIFRGFCSCGSDEAGPKMGCTRNQLISEQALALGRQDGRWRDDLSASFPRRDCRALAGPTPRPKPRRNRLTLFKPAYYSNFGTDYHFLPVEFCPV